MTGKWEKTGQKRSSLRELATQFDAIRQAILAEKERCEAELRELRAVKGAEQRG